MFLFVISCWHLRYAVLFSFCVSSVPDYFLVVSLLWRFFLLTIFPSSYHLPTERGSFYPLECSLQHMMCLQLFGPVCLNHLIRPTLFSVLKGIHSSCKETQRAEHCFSTRAVVATCMVCTGLQLYRCVSPLPGVPSTSSPLL